MVKLITGVGGFIGSSLAQRLLQNGEDVVGVDCFIDYYPREIKEKNLRPLRDYSTFAFIEKNILELDFPKILDGIDGIYHQAAQAGVRASWGEDFGIYTKNNILATQKLLEAVKESRVRVVYASSSSVYGETKKIPMQEDDLPNPVSPYGVSKLAAEHLCRLYWKNFRVPTVSLRYFTVYGPRQRPDMAFHRFLKAIMKGEEITLYGDGEQTRDFTFIKDAVDANLLAMEKGQSGGVYNIGGGSQVTINHCIESMEIIVGKKANVKRLERQKGDVTHTYADTSRAQKKLGFQPSTPLEEGLRLEAKWIQDNIL
ncbi:MAG TPA: GDP-mannose 4,6-dehydratase [Candidatus Sumerlaeota bacterium]|nr:GDP-mannose 4,6-dehydratase [Candidatus Sumerlaeota bacterium]HON49982.1 GDP-mannose 4,6-dehydratase [Candidatus Sumerlaeota bacterium]HOR63770.1 GDP-mannose 4,6-dehydratase [Candidatus Sumerlaeota bacterium]HPL74478.1 GDP-mannose 4,6-dehydratase [Candidatus Sumerlaeota bacterium]HRR31940.1 GDP-mannose 4,6-dehydratase [Candidatus Sumerlaeia bacterium]